MDETLIKKEIAKIARSPKNVRFESLVTLLDNHIRRCFPQVQPPTGAGFTSCIHGRGENSTIVKPKQGCVKRVYVDYFLEAMEAVGLYDSGGGAMKALEEYLKLKYKASVYQDEDDDYVVEVYDLPGCVTHGETVEEAFENLEEAKRVWMESRLAAGLEIPRPKKREEYSGRVLLRMPRSLHRGLSNQAQQEGVSLNQHIVSLLSMGYAWGQTTVVNVFKDGTGTSPWPVLGPDQLTGCSVPYGQDYRSGSLV